MVGRSKQKKEEKMNSISFKVESMRKITGSGHLKAFADVLVNDELVIRGVRLLEGKNGLFVSMPQEKGKDNKWYDHVVCKKGSLYGTLAQTVIDHYSAEPARV